MQTDGLRRYLYEYMIYRSIERTNKAIDAPLMTSAARHLRVLIEERLQSNGHDLNDPTLQVSPVLESIGEVLKENVEGAPTLFSPANASSEGYNLLYSEFCGYTGMSHETPIREGGGETRLPISPYDPRFAHRSAALKAGTQLMFVTESDMDTYIAGGTPALVATSAHPEVKLKVMDDQAKLQDVGPLQSIEDMVGLSELSLRMSDREYKNIHDHVLAGIMNETRSGYDMSKVMSPETLGRSLAMLDYLRDEGIEYQVKPDIKEGQIKASIVGSNIDIRLVDSRENEAYVGSVYDNGSRVYFSSSMRMPKEPGSKSFVSVEYQATTQDTINLLRFAMGKEVQRTDGLGVVGASSTREVRGGGRVNDSYRALNTTVAKYGMMPGSDTHTVSIRRTIPRQSRSTTFFADNEAAETYLENTVIQARANFDNEVDVEGLIQAFDDNQELIEAGEYAPIFSGNTEIAAIQRSYWDVLTGARDSLLKPGQAEEDYYELLQEVGEFDLSTEDGRREYAMRMNDFVYTGDVRDQIRAHSVDATNSLIGTYDLHSEFDIVSSTMVQRRFDPTRVAAYANASGGTWNEIDNIVAAMRKLEMDPKELLGNEATIENISNRLIKFDPENAFDMESHPNEFIARMGGVVRSSIERNGGVVDSVRIDELGIVRYEARRAVSQQYDPENDLRFSGEIGQIFAPGEYGEITTKFGGGNNYMFVPGYEARVRAQKAGENKSLEERTIARGYEEILTDEIEYTIANTMVDAYRRESVGEPTNLNGLYKRLYSTRHEVDFMERSAEEGLSPEIREAILATEARRIRYPNSLKDGSTIYAEYMSRDKSEADRRNDNNLNMYNLTGQRDMSQLDEKSDGYFDRVLTSDSTNQGIVRFLVESARVENGQIIQGDFDDSTPLMKLDELQFGEYDAWDRRRMTGANMLVASAVTEPLGVAMMTFGGFNADDPFIISKETAERYKVRAKNGEMRPLVVGDKLSDEHGNKGVISLIIDREMDLEEAETLGLGEAVQTFRDNPSLDVVMAPFPGPSRYNGGTAREMMSGKLEDLSLPSGEVVPNAVGRLRMTVTHKTVDAGTRAYGDDELAAGKARKLSSQAVWTLTSAGANTVIRDSFASNISALENLNEHLNVCGMGIDEFGNFTKVEEGAVRDQSRYLFEMPELDVVSSTSSNGVEINKLSPNMAKQFGELIGQRGGDLEMPFPLEFPTGVQTPVATSDENGPKSWAVPLMSSHLRSGQRMNDGSVSRHEYTNYYVTMFTQANEYRFAQAQLEKDSLTTTQRAKHEKTLRDAPAKAQSSFNSITRQVVSREFEGKHNAIRESVMSTLAPNSATAVWTSDPRLKINEMAISPALADAVGIKDGEYGLVWRDPQIRDAGMRAMKFKIDDRISSVAINPMMDKGFEGDFDGDSVAVVKLPTEAAREEARRILSVEANLIDTDAPKTMVVGSDGAEHEVYPLLMHEALDVKVSEHEKPSLKTDFADLCIKANEIHDSHVRGEISIEEMLDKSLVVADDISDFYQEALGDQYGGAVLQFGDADEHMRSVIRSAIDTGAKGNMAKLGEYARAFGARPQERSDAEREALQAQGMSENEAMYQWEDAGHTLQTRQDDLNVQKATAIKSHATGMAGSSSQKAMRFGRNVCPKAALGVTAGVTQSILQSKHDAAMAIQRYETLMVGLTKLWEGKQIRSDVGSDGKVHWSSAKDAKGKEIQADRDTWVKQFEQLYQSKDGLNVAESVNRENIEAVADMLTGADGKIISVTNTDEQLVRQMVAPMDQLAYGGTLETYIDLANQGANLYAGKNNELLMPAVIRNNIKARDKSLEHELETGVRIEPEYESIQTKSVSVEYQPRIRRSEVAKSTRAPREQLEEADVLAAMHTSDAPVAEYRPAYTARSSATDKGEHGLSR